MCSSLLQCIFSSQDLWQRALSPNEQEVLKEQLTRLDNALWKATGLLAKWSEPMFLGAAVRFLKANLDKEDIKDVSVSLKIRHYLQSGCRDSRSDQHCSIRFYACTLYAVRC